MKHCPTCGHVYARPDASLLASLPLTSRGRRLCQVLFKNFGKWVPAEHLVEVLYADDPEGGPQTAFNCLANQLGRINRSLRVHGLEVRAPHRGPGGEHRRLFWVDAQDG